MGNKKNVQDRLTVGSKYLIRSLHTREETLETSGTFRGYLTLGRDQALRMELDDEHEEPGKIRIIPSHMVIHIDIIEEVEEEEDDGKDTSRSSYFG